MGFIVVLASFLLGQSSVPRSIPAPIAQNIPANGVTQSDLFEKKAEYEKYREMLENNLEQDQYVIESIYQVFYSPIQNSCLSATYSLYSAHGTLAASELLSIDDVLTKENVWVHSYNSQMKYWDAEMILDTQISKLK